MIGISTSIIRTARSDSLEDEGDEGRDELNETEKRIARIMLNESPPLGAMGKRGSSFEAAALGLRMPSFELDDQETVAEEPAPFSSGAACCPAGDVVAQVDKPAEKYRLEQGAFTKEAVPSSVPVTSSLSLMVVGLLRKSSLREEPGGLGGMVPIKPVGKGVPIKPAKKGASGPGSMKVAIEAAKAAEKKFKLHIFFEVDAPPVQLVIQGKCSVAEAISRALFKYKEEEREPQLASYSSENYEFRMLEDDEDDGTPDLDMPPLDRNKHVADCGIASVALCPVAGFDVSAAFENQKKQQHARSISLQINTKRAAEAAANGLAGLEMLQPLFVRVHVLLGPKDKQTYTVSLRRQQRLIELLPLIQKKIHASNSNLVILDFASLPPVPTFGCIFFAQDVKLEPKFFKFVDMNDQELDYQMTLEETKTDELQLINKFPNSEPLEEFPQTDSAADMENPDRMLDNPMLQETAFEYSQYAVVKTNWRGKRQQRMLGIDKWKIHNKPVGEQKKKLFSRIAVPHRPISTCLSCRHVPNKSTAFEIQFSQKKGNPISRVYEAETVTECNQILEKLNFLISWHRSNNDSNSTET